MIEDNKFTAENLRLPDGVMARKLSPTTVPRKAKHFIRMPMHWFDRLDGAGGHTWQVALKLLYLCWRQNGTSVQFSNKGINYGSISRATKWRALRELEHRGLIEIECRSRRSPIVKLNLFHG